MGLKVKVRIPMLINRGTVLDIIVLLRFREDKTVDYTTYKEYCENRIKFHIRYSLSGIPELSLINTTYEKYKLGYITIEDLEDCFTDEIISDVDFPLKPGLLIERVAFFQRVHESHLKPNKV
jgi:hypothetical protein